MKEVHINTQIFFGEKALDRLSQIPYDKVLIITDPFVVSSGMITLLTARSGIRIIEPAWLREKLLHMARKAIDNNSDL